MTTSDLEATQVVLDMTATTLRPLRPADLPAAQALTAGFGWPHRVEDWAFMHRLGRGIVVERNGDVVGTALCWHYGADWASLGLVTISPALQGQGLGRRLMQELIGGLGGRTILLHATEAGLPFYQALGFQRRGTVRQHQGAALQAGLTALPGGERLRPVSGNDLRTLAALDRAACGMERDGLLAALIETASGDIAADRPLRRCRRAPCGHGGCDPVAARQRRQEAQPTRGAWPGDSFAVLPSGGSPPAMVDGSADLHPLAPPRGVGPPARTRAGAGCAAWDDVPRRRQHPRAPESSRGCQKTDTAAQRDRREALGRSRGGYGTIVSWRSDCEAVGGGATGGACVIADAIGRAVALILAPSP